MVSVSILEYILWNMHTFLLGFVSFLNPFLCIQMKHLFTESNVDLLTLRQTYDCLSVICVTLAIVSKIGL